MRSGIRAPLDSPRKTKGRPRVFATSLTWRIFFMLITLDEAPSTVKSFDTTATVRPAMRPKPAILPSAGVRSRISGRIDAANSPDSVKLPGSSSRSSRSRALRFPSARRRSTLSGPPMPSAFCRRRSNSAIVSSNGMRRLLTPRAFSAARLRSLPCKPKRECRTEVRSSPRLRGREHSTGVRSS